LFGKVKTKVPLTSAFPSGSPFSWGRKEPERQKGIEENHQRRFGKINNVGGLTKLILK